MKRYLLFGLFSAICLTLVVTATVWNLQTQKPTDSDASSLKDNAKKADFVPGEVLVTFKNDLPVDDQVLGLESDTVSDPRLKRLKQKHIDTIERVLIRKQRPDSSIKKVQEKSFAIDRTYKLTISQKEKADTLRLVDELKKDPNVEEVTPNYIRHTTFTPNDSLYSQQWALNQANNFDINAPEAWDQQKGSASIIVAVIDTGIYLAHPEFAGRIFNNPGETGTDAQSRDKKTNGVDDDGNGYVDDWEGYDMTTCGERLPLIGICTSTKVRDNIPNDDVDGHGTHTSGIIAATGNNSLGVAGVNWNSKILPVRALSDGSGSCSDIIAGVAYAAQFADVISMSIGGSSPCAGEASLFTLLHTQNIVVIASAGNESSSERSYPAASPFVISVASLDRNGSASSFSNFGDWVDLTAPGGDILSTMIPGGTLGCTVVTDGYATCSGTSMSAPYVSGVASLILSKNPNLTADSVFAILANSAKDVGTIGRDDATGYGLVDAQKALTDMNITPPPQVVITSPVDGMLIGKSFQIMGTAKANAFTRYQIDYASISSPQNFQTTGITLATPTTQVTDGLLANWNLQNFSPGEYILRLTAITATGSFTTTKHVIYDTTITTGWPKAIGRSDIVVSTDLNNDGNKELIVQSEDALNVFTKDGAAFSSSWPKTIPFENVEFVKTPVVGNVSGDTNHPGQEIVSTILHADSTFDIYAYFSDGTLVTGWPQKGSSDSGILGNFALTDLNGDGLDELIYQTITPNSQLQLIARKGDGTILPGWENVIIDSAYTEHMGMNSVPAVGTITSDGKKGIVVSNYEGSYPVGQTKVKAYASNGTKLWEHTIQANSGYLYDVYITLGDLTGDGTAETIVLYGTQDLFFNQHMHLLVLNQNGQALGQFNSLDVGINDVYATLMLGDLTGDGKPEIVVSDEWEGKYTVVDNQGHVLPGFPLNTSADRIGQLNAIVDVDGNGTMELSADFQKLTSTNTIDSYSDLLSYNKTSGALSSFPLFPKHFGNSAVPKSHVLTDINNDGKSDYVSLTSFSSQDFLYVFNIGLILVKPEWPQYLHDEKHTNSYTKASVFLGGDANEDGVVDGIDFTIWLTNYNKSVTGVRNGDFNTDGKVDGIDFTIWLGNYGRRGGN